MKYLALTTLMALTGCVATSDPRGPGNADSGDAYRRSMQKQYGVSEGVMTPSRLGQKWRDSYRQP